MKKTLMAVFLFVISSTSLMAQESLNGPMDAAIIQQANTMAKHFLSKDYSAFAKFSHPTTLELMGGEEKMVTALKESFSALEAEGVTFLSLKFTPPAKVIVADEGQLQTTLTQMIEMKVVGGIMTAYATVVAVSMDGGKSWVFADTAGNDLNNMRKVIPTLSPKLVLPETLEPTFVPDAEK